MEHIKQYIERALENCAKDALIIEHYVRCYVKAIPNHGVEAAEYEKDLDARLIEVFQTSNPSHYPGELTKLPVEYGGLIYKRFASHGYNYFAYTAPTIHFVSYTSLLQGNLQVSISDVTLLLALWLRYNIPFSPFMERLLTHKFHESEPIELINFDALPQTVTLAVANEQLVIKVDDQFYNFAGHPMGTGSMYSQVSA